MEISIPTRMFDTYKSLLALYGRTDLDLEVYLPRVLEMALWQNMVLEGALEEKPSWLLAGPDMDLEEGAGWLLAPG